MFIKSAMRAPFYFFAGEDGGGGGAAPAVVTEVTPAPAGAPGAAAASSGTLGTPPAPAAKETPAPKEAVVKETPKEPVAAKETPKPTVTAVDGPAPKDGDPKPAPLEWPEDWRAKLAGDDKKLIDRLSRMKDPKDLLNAYRELEGQLSSGKFAKKLPTHYTAEELADYKKANGIPDKPEGYDDNIGNGIVWGEHDKPHIDNFKAFAHEHNMTPEQVKQGLGWWAQYQQTIVNDLDAADQNNMALARADLRATWGGKHDGNLTFLKNQFEGEKGMFATLMTARGPDGRLIGDNPDAVKFLYKKFADADPQAADSVFAGKGTGGGKDIATRLEELNVMMKNKNSAYYKGPTRDAIQAEWRDLYEANERMKARASA